MGVIFVVRLVLGVARGDIPSRSFCFSLSKKEKAFASFRDEKKWSFGSFSKRKEQRFLQPPIPTSAYRAAKPRPSPRPQQSSQYPYQLSQILCAHY
jgi:hypothetical protein